MTRRSRVGAVLVGASLSVLASGCCGGAPRRGPSAACPDGMALVDGRFCVDRYEASLVVDDGGVERPHPPNQPVGGAPVRAVSRAGVIPQAYVSQREAAAACAASGKRLCADDEWRAACGDAFPYGVARRAGACNDEARASPLVQVFGRRAPGTPYSWRELNDPRLGLVPGGVAATGAFTGCRGASGAMDLVGNLHEWTADPAGTFRGGFYGDARQHGEGCAYVTTAHDAAYRDYSTGFRCCAEVRASAP